MTLPLLSRMTYFTTSGVSARNTDRVTENMTFFVVFVVFADPTNKIQVTTQEKTAKRIVAAVVTLLFLLTKAIQRTESQCDGLFLQGIPPSKTRK